MSLEVGAVVAAWLVYAIYVVRLIRESGHLTRCQDYHLAAGS